MSFTAFTAQATLNALFGKSSAFGALASRPTLYVALCDANGAEPTGGGYARVATSTSSWTAATYADPSVVTNATVINFGTASADWLAGEDLTKVRLYDAVSAGNKLLEASLTIPKAVLAGTPVSFPVGYLVCQLG